MKTTIYPGPPVCAECGGTCCRRQPGACFPEDFGPDIEAGVRAAVATGGYTLDWWDGDPREGADDLAQAYFVRPAIKGHEGEPSHAAWAGPCTFLEEGRGCRLPAEARPGQCRGLQPREEPGGRCVQPEGSTKRAAAIAWLPHNEFLEKIATEEPADEDKE